MTLLAHDEVTRLTQEKGIQTSKSRELYQEATKLLPSGVSSLQRLSGFADHPIYMKKGWGSRIVDVDGNQYIDLLMGFGTLINGHSHPRIVQAISAQAQELSVCGAPAELEVEVARKVTSIAPAAQMVAFCNSGTEATMNALRIARAVTGKSKILKFEGAYHGQHDYVLFSVEPIQPGLEISPFKSPYQPGIPDEVERTVVVAPWNDTTILEKIMRRNRDSIAAIITEPIMANSGVIMPEPGFLQGLRELADKHEALLIFDEVLTGFRIAPGGASQYFGVTPDMVTFGKALGGGVPIAAVGGKREIMEMIAPGKIGFGGTYNANPLSLAGAKANLQLLEEDGGAALSRIRATGELIMKGLEELADDAGLDVLVQGVGSLFQIFFTNQEKIRNYREAARSDPHSFQVFQQSLLQNGVYLHPDHMERWTISSAHSPEDAELVLGAAADGFRKVASLQA